MILVQALVLANLLTCGESKFDGKIVGGIPASISQFPHSVYLLMSVEDSYGWSCGSSILTDMLLLSAAHCLHELVELSNYKVVAYAGTANLEEEVKYKKKVKKYLLHQQYDPHTLFCDVSLLLLETSLELGATTQRVVIMPSFPQRTTALMAGWGATDGTVTYKLKQVFQEVHPSSTCGRKLYLLEGMMCGSSGDQNEYAASGDSGSALMRESYQQIGIVSMKQYDSRGLVVYSNVTYFYSWIDRTSSYLFCSRNRNATS